MGIGPAIRGVLGPFERPISGLYRSVFIDLREFVGQIQQWTRASEILELGCGEGAVAEELVRSFPEAHVTGIDITPRVGRMYRGDPRRVSFKQQSIQEFAPENENQGKFDLVVICDIMHHIPWEFHKEILTHTRKVLRPGSHLVLKDWERTSTFIHLLCYSSDRFITGDHVQYKSVDEFRELLVDVFGPASIKAEARIRPQTNNIAFLIEV